MKSFSAILLAITCSSVGATEIVYTPVNPSFGGNPLNGPYLLNNAQSQNKHTESGAGRSASLRQPQTPLEQFNQRLQSAILSRLASSVTGSLVGANGELIPGTVETADFVIDIVDLGGGKLQVTTTDKSTGATTSFQVESQF